MANHLPAFRESKGNPSDRAGNAEALRDEKFVVTSEKSMPQGVNGSEGAKK
jgi:hypothetical protein